MSLKHRIAHIFGWNTGCVVTWWSDDGCAYVGFQCATCGEVTGERMRGCPLESLPSQGMVGLSLEYIASPRCEIVKGLLAHDGDAASFAAAVADPIKEERDGGEVIAYRCRLCSAGAVPGEKIEHSEGCPAAPEPLQMRGSSLSTERVHNGVNMMSSIGIPPPFITAPNAERIFNAMLEPPEIGGSSVGCENVKHGFPACVLAQRTET